MRSSTIPRASMCNQTEDRRERSDYDERAARGEVHIRGTAHNFGTCPLCKKIAAEKFNYKPKSSKQQPRS